MEPPNTLPRLPTAPSAPSAERLRELRDFHFGHPMPGGQPSLRCDELQPAALWARNGGPPGGTGETAELRNPVGSLLAAARELLGPRRAAQGEEIARRRDGLRSLLRVEDGRDPRPDALRGTIGSLGSSLVDTGALADLLGRQRGSVRVDARRRQRIERALEVLEHREAVAEPPLLTVLHRPEDRGSIPEDPQLCTLEADDPCRAAATRFDEVAAHHAELFRALRTARLEIAAAYDAGRHDPWLDALDWEGFTRDELLLVPTVAALEAAGQLCSDHMTSLSRLLRSGRPVHTLGIAAPVHDSSTEAGEQFSSYRLELAFLGIGHREAFVQQTSTARPQHLAAGFTRSLQCTRSALHVIQVEPSDAAIRSREHPLFRYDPEAGGTWARRLDFSGNPDPEADWPAGTLTCSTTTGHEQKLPLRFTWADYALLHPACAGEFQLISDTFASDDLAPVAEFLELDPETASRRVPYVWAIDGDRDLHRLAVTRRLVQACRDRLDFWRTLQELSGVRNEYVERALEHAREEAHRDREELAADQRARLERARNEAVSEAMQRLAAGLVACGPDELAAAVASAPALAPAPGPTDREDDAASPATEKDTEPAPSSEPWIQTPLCTSCNDCRNINPQVFVYDENKQAIIGDPRAGTYAQLVKAAEKCPARCIHPGLPLNPGEPNLSGLIKRAEPFNR